MIKKLLKAVAVLLVVIVLACILAYHFSPDFRSGFDEGSQQTQQK